VKQFTVKGFPAGKQLVTESLSCACIKAVYYYYYYYYCYCYLPQNRVKFKNTTKREIDVSTGIILIYVHSNFFFAFEQLCHS
jgi:hypothetical protein